MDRERFAERGADEQIDGYLHECPGEGLTDRDGWMEGIDEWRAGEGGSGKMRWKGVVGMGGWMGVSVIGWMDGWKEGRMWGERGVRSKNGR